MKAFTGVEAKDVYEFRYIIQEEDVRTIKRYPHVNLRRRWGFGVQCFSISPMHGIAFSIPSFQRTGDRIVRALNMVFSVVVCGALSHLHHLAPIELSRFERFILAGYC